MKKIIWNIRQVLVWPLIQVLKISYLFVERRNCDLDLHQVKKILIYAPMGIGNLVFFTPTLRAIRQRFPEAKITLLVRSISCKELLQGTLLVDKVVLFPKAGVIKELKFVRNLRKERFHLLVSNFLGEGVFLTLLSIFGDIPYRVGHATSPGWKNAKDFINNIKVTMEQSEHEIDRNLRLAYSLGVERHLVDKEPFVHIDEESRKFAEKFLRKLKISDEDLLVGVQFGASAFWKQWSLDNFADLCDRLIEERRAKVMLFGAPSESGMAEYVVSKMRHVPINIVGRTKIKEAAALIERCDLFICNDSGLGKIAIAVNTPTLTVGGPTDKHRTGSWKEGHIDLWKDLPCSPCYTIGMKGLIKAQLCKDRKCLRSITVDDVMDSVAKLLKTTSLSCKKS